MKTNECLTTINMKPDMNAFKSLLATLSKNEKFKSAITSVSASSNTLIFPSQQVNKVPVQVPVKPLSNSGSSIIKNHSTVSVSFKDKCKYISEHYASEPYNPIKPWYDSKKIKQMLEDAEKALLNSKGNSGGYQGNQCNLKRQNNSSFENSQLKRRKL